MISYGDRWEYRMVKKGRKWNEGYEECVMRGGKGGEVWERRFLLPRLLSVIA